MHPDCILPIKKFIPTSYLAKSVTAFAATDAIYVNEENLDKCSLAEVRALLFHVSCHVKYNDIAVKKLVGVSAMVLGGVFTHKLIHKYAEIANSYKIDGNNLPYLHSNSLSYCCLSHCINILAAAGLSAMTANNKYGKFQEKRADIEGHNALKCAICVQRSAINRQVQIDTGVPFIDRGYLSPSELMRLANYFHQKDEKCLGHQ